MSVNVESRTRLRRRRRHESVAQCDVRFQRLRDVDGACRPPLVVCTHDGGVVTWRSTAPTCFLSISITAHRRSSSVHEGSRGIRACKAFNENRIESNRIYKTASSSPVSARSVPLTPSPRSRAPIRCGATL